MSSGIAEELLSRLRAAAAPRRERLLGSLDEIDPRLRTTFERLLADEEAESLELAGGALDGPLGEELLRSLDALPATVGDTIGTVELVEILGEGGMGTVFRGFDAKLRRPVAVKTVRADRRPGDTARLRFRREATTLSQLNHPAICQVYDLIERPEADYLVLELVEGGTLRDWMREERPVAARLDVATRIAEALAFAHARGIVHRDLKPENVMVNSAGEVKVLDFGIARAVDAPAAAAPGDDSASTRSPGAAVAETEPLPPALRDTAGPAFRTRLGTVVGTVAYMSPEQARGDDVTEATDLYSLGALVHELMAGSSIHGELSGEALLERVRRGDVTLSGGLDAGLSGLLAELLAARPGDRPSAAEAARRLSWIAARPRRLRRRLLVAGLAAASLGVSYVATVLLRESPERTCREAGAELSRVWSPGARARLLRGFAALGDDGRQVGDRVARRLDEYAGSWREMRVDSCLATLARGEQSSELLDRRTACLDRGLARVGALADVLASPAQEDLEGAVAAVDALPPLALCADRDLLLATVPLPAEPARREALAALEEQLARGFALADAGRTDEARESVSTIESLADALAYRPAEARAHYLVGKLARAQDEFATAAEVTFRGLTAALAGGDDESAIRALAQLVFVTGSDLADLEAARRWRAMGEALVERVGRDTLIAAELDHAIGTTLLWNDLPAAVAALQRADAVRQRELGSRHAESIRTRVNLSSALYLEGEFAASARLAAENAADATLAVGERHPFVATALGNVGSARLAMGEAAAALAAFLEARAILDETRGPDSLDAAAMDLNIAMAQVDLEHYTDGLERAERASVVFSTILPADHPYHAYPEFALGSALLGLDRAGAARSHLERAVSLFERQSVLATELPEARFGLARALWIEGRDRTRALRLARQAAASLDEIDWATRLRGEVGAWLAERDRGAA